HGAHAVTAGTAAVDHAVGAVTHRLWREREDVVGAERGAGHAVEDVHHDAGFGLEQPLPHHGFVASGLSAAYLGHHVGDHLEAREVHAGVHTHEVLEGDGHLFGRHVTGAFADA